jgi:hypothetical protein
MKKVFILLILILIGSMILYSQVPQAMTYKAIAKDDWGVALPNKAITLRFTIIQGSEIGPEVYRETQYTVTNKFGLMDVQIGKGIADIGYFPAIDWSLGIYYIKIEMDPKGGSDFRLEDPAHQLLSVPYALYAGSSADVFSGNYNDLYNRPTRLSEFSNDMGFIAYESDPVFTAHPANGITSGNITNWNTAFGWGNHAGLYRPVDYVPAWSEITSKPTTLTGYGITDAMNTSHAANGITESNIINWNTAYSWGTHAGLYKPISYVPAWGDVTDNPFSITSSAADQLLKYNTVTSKWENWTPTFLVTEVDGSVTNEIQDLNLTEDKLIITNNPAALEIDLTQYKADGSETKIVSGINVTVTGSGTTASPYSINSTSAGVTGNNPGDMQYWDGKEWVLVPVGSNGQVLTLVNGVPTWESASLPIQLPVLITTPVSNIRPISANSGGIIVIDGGSPVAARGVCWNTSENPTIANSNTIDGYGIGVFTSSITGLTLGNTYYVRAYATNSAGTTYGNEISFTANPGLATLSTTAITSIAATKAYSGGNVSDDGGASVTERGVCWSTSENPTISDNKTIDGSGAGSFSSSLTKLAANTTYYVLAYATNAAGTAYGNELSFTTPTLSIGDNYQGGKVAYILQPGDLGYIAGETHGLIAAPSEVEGGESWNGGNNSVETGPTSTALGTGNENTNTIVTSLGVGSYAAYSCYILVSGGYSDWYLPSQDELYKIYLNQAAIGGFDQSGSGVYWSSSESNVSSAARTQSFFDGTQSDDLKGSNHKVRAVRSF